jgi:uroporphyrinogen-III decarboxylase
MRSTCTGIQFIRDQSSLLPVGMCIGPFSLMSKLMFDPITAVYLYASGRAGIEDPLVATLLGTLELSTVVVSRYIQAQIEAGAKLILLCEPAANIVYISPRLMEKGGEVFDQCVIKNIRRIKKILDERGVDLFLHDCGELTDKMVEKFSQLDPAILSLGSSRQLWKDARLVSANTVLYGNLPSKKFYSDELISPLELKKIAENLIALMRQVGHPFILGTECDVLSVPGYHHLISEKVKIITDISKYQSAKNK